MRAQNFVKTYLAPKSRRVFTTPLRCVSASIKNASRICPETRVRTQFRRTKLNDESRSAATRCDVIAARERDLLVQGCRGNSVTDFTLRGSSLSEHQATIFRSCNGYTIEDGSSVINDREDRINFAADNRATREGYER